LFARPLRARPARCTPGDQARVGPRRRAIAGALAVGALAIAGCGRGSTGVSTGAGAPTQSSVSPTSGTPTPGVANGALPHVLVNDVGAGAKIDLASVATGDRPLLVWFWAPH